MGPKAKIHRHSAALSRSIRWNELFGPSTLLSLGE
jgi:hypothetical protein